MVKRLDLGGVETNVAPFPTAIATPPPSLHSLQAEPPAAPIALVPQQAQPTKLPITIEELGKIGGDAQTQLASVTSKITGVAKTSDMDEMGKLLQNTIMAAKGYDPDKLFKGGLFGFFKAKSTQIRMKFDNVDQTVQRLVGEVDQRIGHFRQRVQDLDQLAEANKQYHDSLTPQIEHVTATADWMEQNQPQVDPNDPLSAQFVQDWITVINFARKRADDLRRAQILAQQQAAQIQQMKTNSSALAQKFGDIKVTTIPAMQQTFTLYVINLEQKKGAEFADQVDALTNDAITKNAQLMGQNTTAIHTSLTRSNISMEALKANYDSITQSLDEVRRIQAEMKTRLASEAPQLEQLSQDLTKRLSQR
jgi:uncharacterized protein YaaN involved in tellurite resistance